jgi:plastocyanin
MIRRAALSTFAVTAALVPVGLVAAPAAHAGGSCHQASSTAAGSEVRMQGLCFEPTTLRLDEGDTVTFVNAESTPHTVTGLGFQWGSGDELRQGDSVTARFDGPGVYAYSCILHPGMVGAVVVGDPPIARSGDGATGAADADPLAAPTVARPTDAPTEGTALAASSSRGDGGDGLGAGPVTALAVGGAVAGSAVTLAVRRQRRAPAA